MRLSDVLEESGDIGGASGVGGLTRIVFGALGTSPVCALDVHVTTEQQESSVCQVIGSGFHRTNRSRLDLRCTLCFSRQANGPEPIDVACQSVSPVNCARI